MDDGPPLARRDGDDVAAAPAVADGGGAPSNNDASAGDDGAPPPARRRVHNPYNTRSSSFKRRRGGSPSPPPRRCVARRDATHNAGSVWALFSIPGEDEQPAGPTFRRFADIDADDAADAAPPDLPIRRSDAATLPRRGGGAMDTAATKYSILDRDTGTETFPFTPTANQKRIILECIASVWGIHSPRPFQVFAISAMVYLPSQFLYLIRKTGEGKSLVILTTATLLRGVTVVMVPLIGLGSDQVAKSFRLDKRVEAYHVDEHRGDDFKKLAARINAMKTGSNGRVRSSIIALVSPQTLDPKSDFSRLLRNVARRNLLTSIFVDEAHSIHREGMQGSDFRPEFDAAYTNLMDIAKSMPSTPNVCVMSASLPQVYQDTITNLSKRQPSMISWGDMARRSIFFGVHVFGRPSAAIKRKLAQDFTDHPDRKVLVYTNSKLNAETTLTTVSESVLERLELAGDVIPLTGDCGIMMKTYLMRAFCGSAADDDVAPGDDATDMELPNIVVMPCTSAANCGVSSMHCFRALRYSIPPNLIDVLQEMGRVDRGHDAARGDHRYEVYLSFDVVMNLFLRIFHNKSSSIRDFELGALFDVLRFLILPTECYHVYLERHFEQPCDGLVRPPCGDNCTYCIGCHRMFTRRFERSALVNILLCEIFDEVSVTLKQLLKKLTENAIFIYGEDEALVKDLEPGNIHALALQLVAARFIEVYVEDGRMLGSAKLNKTHLRVKLVKGGRQFRICDASLWAEHGFNCQ